MYTRFLFERLSRVRRQRRGGGGRWGARPRGRRRGAAHGRPSVEALLSLGFLPAGGSPAGTRAPAAPPAPSAKPELIDPGPPPQTHPPSRGPGNRHPLPPGVDSESRPPSFQSGSPPRPHPLSPRAGGGGPSMAVTHAETPLQTGPARPPRGEPARPPPEEPGLTLPRIGEKHNQKTTAERADT